MKLGTLLSAMALRYADREAVVCGDRRITFKQLNATANRVANAFIGKGIVAGANVAAYMPNGAELVEGMAGILKLGGVVVPISTRLTVPEVSFMLKDSDPAAIIFTVEYRSVVLAAIGNDRKILKIVVGGDAVGDEITFADFIATGSDAEPPVLASMPDDCVIGYTSGTTGKPKGAIGTHMAFVLVHGYLNAIEFGLTDKDVVLITTPMAHRNGLGRMANMFAIGCKLVVTPKFDAAETRDVIEREGVTMMGSVPTVIRLLLPEIERNPHAFRSLRLMVATGEAFPVEGKKRLFAALPKLELYSFYAQTESGFITGLRPDEQLSHPTSIGRSVPGLEVRLGDKDMKDVPVGTAGEILVRCGTPGTLTMRAYYKRPEATAETIVDGWVRTGDIARKDEDGYYYFVDRAKDMVISGGYNIYSKEVELALISHPAVADAAVVGMPDEVYGESVTAFVELEKGQSATQAELIDHCRYQLASYKKPKRVFFLDALPRTSTGKPIKAELKTLAAASPAS